VKKILITGGAGFVGQRFCKRFLDAGDEVHCVDPVATDTGGLDPDAGWPLYNPRDYRNFHYHAEDCRHWFRSHDDGDFDYAVHLAAMVGGRAMIENRPLAVADDLSIDAEYWQWAKLTCEYLARVAHEKHGLRSVCYRPFSGYGEDQDDSYPFPSIIKRALAHAGEPVLRVWGTGDQMRDFIHIEDCVDGALGTMDMIDDGDALNLSTGIYTSFKQFARMAAEAIGYSPEVVGLSDQPAGVFARGGDTSKQVALGFRARMTFSEGIREALDALQRKPVTP
jgi:nucleoside-diphosphate-sugar epimerase